MPLPHPPASKRAPSLVGHAYHGVVVTRDRDSFYRPDNGPVEENLSLSVRRQNDVGPLRPRPRRSPDKRKCRVCHDDAGMRRRVADHADDDDVPSLDWRTSISGNRLRLRRDWDRCRRRGNGSKSEDQG